MKGSDQQSNLSHRTAEGRIAGQDKSHVNRESSWRAREEEKGDLSPTQDSETPSRASDKAQGSGEGYNDQSPRKDERRMPKEAWKGRVSV